MRRTVVPELLDRDAGTAQEIQHSLGDLRRINRWFGGVSTTSTMLERVARALRRDTVSLLDVGSGSGDIARAVQRRMARRHLHLDVTLVDRSPAHMSEAPPGPAFPPERRRSVRHDACAYGWPLRRVVAEALALPFAGASFDLVSCALLAHHFEPAQLVAFVAEALRVCRAAVLINDLRRSALSLALVYAGFPLFRSRLTRHDGPASVRRAYTLREMRSMLCQAGAWRVEVTPHYLFRMGAIVWKCTT